MTVLYNTNYTHNPNSYLTLAVLDAAREVFGDGNVVLADNRSLAPLAASGAHDVLICLDGQRLHEGLLRRVRHAFGCVALWQFEDPFMLDYNLQHLDLFDHVFTNDPACVAAYGAKGHYLPLAASQALHFRPVKPDAELDYDIFFAGTMWPNRVQSLRRIVAAFPDARLKLVCPTNDYLPPLPSDLARRAIQWPISHEAFIDFANASRVTLTMFRDYASHGDAGQAAAPGPRLYELALAGTAQVAQCGEAMDRARFDATPGVDVAGDPAQLVDAIRRLLADPALRAERALQAQRQVAIAELYAHRLRAMRETVGPRFDVRSPAPRDARPPTPPSPASRKLRVLMCTHSTMHRNEWGGVEVYQQTLCAMFEREVDVLFWLRRDGQCHLMDERGAVLERFDMHEIGWLDSLTDAPEEVAFSNVLGQYGIDLVHFQHLGHHAASLPIIAKSAGIGTVFSAHDFFLVCSRYNLLNHEQVFCDIGHKSVSACDICLRIAEKVEAGAQQTRRAFMGEVIRSIDVFLFGTAYSEWLSMRVYPELARRRRVVLGIPTPPNTMVGTRAARVEAEAEAAPLVVAIVGNVLRAKGADALISLIEEANPQLFRFHVLGHAEPAYADVFARWDKPNVTYHGRYAPGDLAKVAGADVALHLSIWPETYCISLSEVWQAGLIPIASDIGAFGDRIEHGKNGFKVGVGDSSAVLDTLELLRASPGVRRAVRANIGPHLWTDARAYAAALLAIYRSVTPARPLGDAGLGLDAGQVHLLAHPSWKTLAPPRHIFDPSRRSSLRLELSGAIQDWSHIQGSEVYIDAGLRPDSGDAVEERLRGGGDPACQRLDLRAGRARRRPGRAGPGRGRRGAGHLLRRLARPARRHHGEIRRRPAPLGFRRKRGPARQMVRGQLPRRHRQQLRRPRRLLPDPAPGDDRGRQGQRRAALAPVQRRRHPRLPPRARADRGRPRGSLALPAGRAGCLPAGTAPAASHRQLLRQLRSAARAVPHPRMGLPAQFRACRTPLCRAGRRRAPAPHPAAGATHRPQRPCRLLPRCAALRRLRHPGRDRRGLG